jgi:hypothetical protein
MKTLIWSVAWGDYRYMTQALVDSIRASGLDEDILTFSDEPLANVVSCEMDKSIEMDFKQYWKFHYLRKLEEMDYDLFVFIDSDHYFVRKPPKGFSEIIGSDPWHSFLESPLNLPSTKRGDWWGVHNKAMVEVYRNFGVVQDTVYNTNGGFWMCKREFIKQASSTGLMFRDYQNGLGLDLPEEVGIAVMSHLFSKDYSRRLHSNYTDVWASEWTGALKDALPDGTPWEFQEYMTNERSVLNPAIVHAMRSKNALTEAGKEVFERTKLQRAFTPWSTAKQMGVTKGVFS